MSVRENGGMDLRGMSSKFEERSKQAFWRLSNLIAAKNYDGLVGNAAARIWRRRALSPPPPSTSLTKMSDTPLRHVDGPSKSSWLPAKSWHHFVAGGYVG